MMSKEKELEERWKEGFINGLAMWIAKSPNEPSEETRKEYEEVKKILEEKNLDQIAKRWFRHLKEVLAGE